jgi:hypothetical protein
MERFIGHDQRPPLTLLLVPSDRVEVDEDDGPP